ncbi:MAG: sulfatase [Verrucomicrobiota bacterium]
MRFILSLLVTFFVIQSLHAETPNFVIIFTDDQGYQDVGCFGSPNIKTPLLDKMASEGMRFTSFYAQTVCGPSRAALMTGSYPLRVATKGNRVEVHPRLHTNEITIAEMLKDVGYTTGAFGKWDLAGHSQEKYEPELLPTHQGFDYYYGTPSSNDSYVNFLRNKEVIEKKAPMGEVTKRLTDEAIQFIQRSADKPFFVYLAHPMPHVKLAVTDEFKGKSAAGIYGDVIEELDWNIGRVLDTLREEGVDENTYVFFMSDNGPWFLGRSQGHKKRIGPDAVKHGGSALPLRGAKTSTWEGGLRVPCIMRAPGKIPAGGVCAELTCTMDLLPTIANLADGEIPSDRVIDGNDITDLIHGEEGAKSQKEAYYYYQQTQLQAVRSGRWKLHLPGPRHWSYYSKAADAGPLDQQLLFDLENDLSETTDVADENPEVVNELLKLVEKARADIGDFNRVGKNARFFDDAPKRPDIKPKN